MASYFSREEAARAQQVRAEIGRLLRQHYDASLPPISERLAEVIKKLEQSESRSVLAFKPIGHPMSRPDEYGAKGKSASAPGMLVFRQRRQRNHFRSRPIGTRRTLKDLSVLGCTPPLPTLASTRRSQQIK